MLIKNKNDLEEAKNLGLIVSNGEFALVSPTVIFYNDYLLEMASDKNEEPKGE